MLKNLKLERANRSEEDTGGWSGAVEELEFRGDAFFQVRLPNLNNFFRPAP